MSSAPLLQLSEVYKSYGGTEGAPETPVLSGVSLTLNVGESAAIVGPSGAGKSTLLNIIGTLDRPDRGSVLLGGKDLTNLSEEDLAQVRSAEIGFIFQLHHLLPQCTALENVLIPTLAHPALTRTEPPQDRAQRLLERVGLGGRFHHRPSQLSGGERQRVAVVRALMNEPRLLLADEPTGALDGSSAENLANLLLELNREVGVALLTITHAPDLAARMGTTYQLCDGALHPVSPYLISEQESFAQ
ncbi:MAG: lipoprotein-releasing ABC transporter ATP-binding protein LolD [Armatimonadaceae bacterium]